MTVQLDASHLNALFPAFIRVNGSLAIVAVGRSLAHRVPAAVPGAALTAVFDLDPPAASLSTAARNATPVLLRAKRGGVTLRGLAVADADAFVLLVGYAGLAEEGAPADPAPEDFSVADGAHDLAADVARLKAALKDAERARERAEASNRSKSEFLARISHQLRTPLHGVIGIVGSLAESPLTDAQAEMVELIHESGEALTQVVDDVLDFARLEAGFPTAVEEPFLLAHEITVATQSTEPELWAKSLDLAVDLKPEVSGRFVGDPARIRQIVTNLLNNAIKSSADGQVGLAARIDGDAAAPRLHLTVIDNGAGMSEADATQLFQNIMPGDVLLPASLGASSLSLAICKALVDQMGGEISVQSTPGKGAAFTVQLPLRRATVAESEVLETAEAIIDAPVGDDDDDAPVRALVAEDHPANRRIIELMLAPMGVEVTLVGNGQEAVEAFKQHDWELILLDMQMPVLDGVSAARAMRDLEAGLGRQRTPIAMLSANVLPRHVDQAMAAGADHFIAKPVTPAALARGLDELIRAAAINAAKASNP